MTIFLIEVTPWDDSGDYPGYYSGRIVDDFYFDTEDAAKSYCESMKKTETDRHEQVLVAREARAEADFAKAMEYYADRVRQREVLLEAGFDVPETRMPTKRKVDDHNYHPDLYDVIPVEKAEF